jgi:Putative adhesin
MTTHAARLAGAIAAGLLALAVPLASAQERGRRTPQTDRTVTVSKGARLSVSNDAGEVILRTWEKDSLRVQAVHSARVTIDIQSTANIVTVRSRSSGGPVGGVDYEITAPAWLPVKVSGQFLYIGIEGAQNEVSAETVRGDIVVKGGSGIVTAKSIEGEVIVEDAKGRINASSVNEGIRITGGIGDVTAESTNGDIALSKVDARSLDVSTVNGDIRYEGSVSASGPYRLSTHNGDITMIVPETTNATFSVRTYNGDFHSNLPTKTVGEVRRGRRATYTLGNGGAEIELESFGGTIRLRRPGTVPAPRGREKQKEEKEKEAAGEKPGDQSARSAAMGSTCAARAAGVADAAAAVSVKSTATVANVHGSYGRT